MTTATFDPAGTSLVVAVTCTPNRNGSYVVKLWEADANKIAKEYHGNFINTADDSYELDPPNSAQDGRIVEAMVVVAIPAGVGPSTVLLTVSQDGVELGRDSGIVAPGSAGQLVDLFVKLEAK